MVHLTNPIYFNFVELTRGDARFGRLELSLDKWHEILTTYDESQGGRLCLRVVPGKNIRVELNYDGDIQLMNKSKEGLAIVSYPTQNPIFDTEFLRNSKEGRYVFQTTYPPLGFQPVSLTKAVKLTRSDNDIEDRQDEVEPELIQKLVASSDNLELILQNLLGFIGEKADHEDNNRDDYYDFSARYREFRSVGSFSGSCKEISTITAGFLNALGLRSKILSAFVDEMVEGKLEPRMDHSFAEVYVPVDEKHGFWLLVDPSLSNLYNSKRFLQGEDVYSFIHATLPVFSDTRKKARIKVRYV